MGELNETSQFLIRHGLPLVFAAVFVEQMGLPIPALPLLLAAGALSAAGKFSFPLGIAATVIACLIPDAFWFYLGRYRGNQVLNFLCRISLEPDSCVRRTQNVFTRYGLRGVVAAKFVPGMSTVAPPLAGMAGVPVGQFLLFDGFGALLYGSSLLCLGYLFSNQIEQIGAAIAHVGGGALSLMAGLTAFYVASTNTGSGGACYASYAWRGSPWRNSVRRWRAFSLAVCLVRHNSLMHPGTTICLLSGCNASHLLPESERRAWRARLRRCSGAMDWTFQNRGW